jgi:hypothetical protein
MSMFGLVASVVLPLIDGSYSRQVAALDSATGLSLSTAFLTIGLLTLAIWLMLGFAASAFAQDLPLNPEEVAGIQRIKQQIEALEAREAVLSEAVSSGTPAGPVDRRLDLDLGRTVHSRSNSIKRDILRLADDLASKKKEAQLQEEGERTSDRSLAPSSNRSRRSDVVTSAVPTEPLLNTQRDTSNEEDADDDPTAPDSDPDAVDTAIDDPPKLVPMGEFISEEDLSVEVTADPSGAWDPTLPSSTGTAGIYRYTEVLDDLVDDFDFEPDPETEELEDLWKHLAEPWLRNAMAQAERLADRLPNEAHIEVSNSEHTPFTLVIEGTAPGLTMRTVMLFVDFLADIPTPPNAAIELIRVAHLSRDFHKNVKAALLPKFPNGTTVKRRSNRIDISFHDAYSGWSSYPYLPVDEWRYRGTLWLFPALPFLRRTSVRKFPDDDQQRVVKTSAIPQPLGRR